MPDLSSYLPTAFASSSDQRACAGIRQDFANCLLRTDCVLKKGMTPKECIERDDLPEECQFLRKSLSTCKRGMVRLPLRPPPSVFLQMGVLTSLLARQWETQLDMRKRFRGNPSTTNNRKETVPAVSIVGVNAHESADARAAAAAAAEKAP